MTNITNSIEANRQNPKFKHLWGLCILISISFTGCTGVKFTDRGDFNLALSPEMLGHSIFKDTEIVKRHLEDVPGYIVQDDGAGNLKTVVPLIVGGFVPPVTPIKDDQAAFYHSFIDGSAGIQGSYLSILSADLSVSNTAEVTITETAESYIPNEKVPWDKIVEWGKNHPTATNQPFYYVQGVLLSTVVKTKYSEVKSSATVDGGAAYGAKGKIYATHRETETSHFALIGAHLLDVGMIVKDPPQTNSVRRGAYEILTTKPFKGLEMPQ